MNQTITREELDKWQDYLIGEFCPKHPQSRIAQGNYGLWCGNKTELGTWCDGGFPTEEFINNLRKGQSNDQ